MNHHKRINMTYKEKCINTLLLVLVIALPGFSQNYSGNSLFVIKALNSFNEPNEAIRYIGEVNTDNGNWELQLEKGNTYYLIEDYKKAINYYLEANKLNKKAANFELAKCYANLDKPEFSMRYLSLYLSNKNKMPLSRVKSDNAFEKINNTEEWKALWETEWYSDNELLYNDADYEYRIGNYNESIRILESVIRKRPSFHNAHSLLCSNYEKLEDYNEALFNINNAIDFNPKNHEYYYQRSTILFSLIKPKKALKDINKAISLDSTFIDYNILRTNIYLVLEENTLAKEEISRMLEFSKSTAIYKIAGKTYYQNANYLMALKYYNICIDQKSFSPELYIERGDVYLKCGPYEYAEKDYSMALDFYPKRGVLYHKRALARINQKNYEAACRDLNKARNYGFMESEDWIKRFCQ